MAMACEDANSKLVEVVTVADVDDENHVGNSLLQIWKLRFGHKAKLLFRLSAQGLVRSLKLKFRRDFEAEVWSVFFRFAFGNVCHVDGVLECFYPMGLPILGLLTF